MTAKVRPGGRRSRRAGRLAGALLLTVTAGIGIGVPAGAQEPPGPDGRGSIDLDSLRDQYEELVGDEADLLVQYDLVGARLAELRPQVQDAQRAVERADEALFVAQVELTRSVDDEEEAETALTGARDHVASAEDRLRQHAVESYMGGGDADAMAVVLEVVEGNDGSLARRGYRTAVDDQQGELIDELLAARRQSREAVRDARAAAADAERTRDDVDTLRGAADDALAETIRLTRETAAERQRQELILIDIRSRKGPMEARIASLEKAADGAAALLAGLRGDSPDWSAGAVDVRIPRAGGTINSEFGMRRHPILDISRLHAGADIGAPAGSPVLAAADGIVVSAEARGGYGNTVVIAHAYSLGTVYAHNSSLSVKVGEVVRQGDEIARAGSTGLSTGPHIHFETLIRGVPVNPRSILMPGDATHGQADDDSDGVPNAVDADPADPQITDTVPDPVVPPR